MRAASSLLVLAAAVLTALPAAAAPTITIEEDRVWVEGLTPNADALVLGISRERTSSRTRVVRRREVITDHEGLGNVEVEVARGVPRHSVWAVVDLNNGMVDVAVPDGRPRREVPQPTHDWLDVVTTEFRYADIVVVRPGRGAWFATAGDGGASDGDGLLDGQINVPPEAMTPLLDGQDELTGLQGGDVVVVVDPKGLRFYVQRVTGAAR